MTLPHDLCARIQNAFRARHAKIAVHHTTQNLAILSILFRAGFVSNITRGTIEEASPEKFESAGDAQRRIWVDLKYRDDRPVLREMALISRSSKRIYMDLLELRRLCSGRRAQKIKPLGMGEIAVVRTKDKENEWLEAREALQLRLSGEVTLTSLPQITFLAIQMDHDGKVAYIVSTELAKISSLLPSNIKRSLLVHSLIKSLGLLDPVSGLANHARLELVRPQAASLKELAQYHDREYLNYIFSNNVGQTSEAGQNLISEWGLEHDCPIFLGLPEYVRAIAGATLTAVKCLQQSKYEAAICWDGGKHHARKSRASGFCYVADCVLALMTFRRPTAPSPSLTSPIDRPRVMYLDLDLHFSDGVSEAFHAPIRSNPPRVLTLSIHHMAPGFFPMSRLGGLIPPDDDLFDPFTLSIPLQEGASNCTYARIWPIVERVKNTFDPDYIVVQCGCDGLAGDPCLKFNWSLGGGDGSMGWCVQRIMNEWTGKKLLLGGGGYNSPNTARAWAYLTSIAVGCPLDLNASIPDHDGFPLYAPSFTLNVVAGTMQEKNSDEYLAMIANHYDYVITAINDRLSRF